MELCEPASDEVVVRDALTRARRFAEGPAEWIRPAARSGLAAFAAWADCLEHGTALLLHHEWNLQVWLDCRETAVTFLAEAKARLTKAEAQFDAAIAQYRVVAERLRQARELMPRTDTTWAQRLAFTSAETAAVIRRAGQAEAEALQSLRRILEAIGVSGTA